MNECGGQSVTEVSRMEMSEAIPNIYMLAMVLSKYRANSAPVGLSILSTTTGETREQREGRTHYAEIK